VAFEIEPSAPVRREIRRIARERLDRAERVLNSLDEADAGEIEEAVHVVRKRCKEVRALARLVRPSLGDNYASFNTTVRDAAELLSPIRDAHAVLATFDDLRDRQGRDDDAQMSDVREHQATVADAATRDIREGDPRISEARVLLGDARKQVEQWKVGKGFAVLRPGIEQSYGRGRRARQRATKKPTDERMHEWRKSVKTLWYHLRLLKRSAPSVLEPLVAQFDDLSEALGDDHDLAILIERLSAHPKRFGGKKATRHAIGLARAQQHDLRRRAIRLSATLYVETTASFADRIEGYWGCAVANGPELATGGIAELAEDEREHPLPSDRASSTTSIERERKFLVGSVPDLPDLAIDGSVSVRVRDAGTCTLTVKAGRGTVRNEFEWPISREQFDAAWGQTRGRRVTKIRHTMPFGEHLIEIDVFHGDLHGLVLAEVEFDSDESLAEFEPPDWFGVEVTDDVAYTNASLAAGAATGQPSQTAP